MIASMIPSRPMFTPDQISLLRSLCSAASEPAAMEGAAILRAHLDSWEVDWLEIEAQRQIREEKMRQLGLVPGTARESVYKAVQAKRYGPTGPGGLTNADYREGHIYMYEHELMTTDEEARFEWQIKSGDTFWDW
jgi:hypothetical protein